MNCFIKSDADHIQIVKFIWYYGPFFIQHWENRHLYSLSILNITVSMKKKLEAGHVAHVCDSGTLKTDLRGFPAQTSLNSKTIFLLQNKSLRES